MDSKAIGFYIYIYIYMYMHVYILHVCIYMHIYGAYVMVKVGPPGSPRPTHKHRSEARKANSRSRPPTSPRPSRSRCLGRQKAADTAVVRILHYGSKAKAKAQEKGDSRNLWVVGSLSRRFSGIRFCFFGV